MPKIIITRSNEYFNKFRDIQIYIDDKKAGAIANNSFKAFELTEGPHTLKAKIDWAGSRTVEFTLSADETKQFYLSGFKYSKLMGYSGLAIIVLHLLLHALFQIEFLIYFAIIPLLFIIYYGFIKRNGYLQIKEE